jgi:hypothetical protein
VFAHRFEVENDTVAPETMRKGAATVAALLSPLAVQPVKEQPKEKEEDCVTYA